jgi:hypothetical protein
MGFDLLLISTGANGLKVPIDAKCVFCGLLLDDGISLSGCGHNACYHCMYRCAEVSPTAPTCPMDGRSFKPKQSRYLSREIELWLRECRIKCRWFDGYRCTATRIALHNVGRHETCCRNRPNKYASAGIFGDDLSRPTPTPRKRQRSVTPAPDAQRMDSRFRRSDRAVNATYDESAGARKATNGAVAAVNAEQEMAKSSSTTGPQKSRPSMKYNTKQIEDWITDMSIGGHDRGKSETVVVPVPSAPVLSD